MKKIEREVNQYIDRHDLLSPSGRYLVALSGGADSVALFRMLLRLDYKVEAVHCNFKLRGEESFRDETFCKNLCREHGVTFHTVHFDTAEYASLHKLSIEMAARELRYNHFEKLRNDLDMDGICVAHHKDDNVETMLINLVRGTGLSGLTGMTPQNGYVLRPLLAISHTDLLEYLQELNQPYVTDSTNLTTDFTRNKIRLTLVPLLEELNPAATDNIAKTIDRLAEAEKVFNHALKKHAKDVIVVEEETPRWRLGISIGKLQQTPSPEYVLFQLIHPLGFTPAQIEQIAQSLDQQTGKLWQSSKFTLVIDRKTLLIEESITVDELARTMRIPEEGNYVFTPNVRIKVSKGVNDEHFTPSKMPHCVHLDMANIAFPLMVRHIRTGDRFVPFGMRSSKLVSDFLTDRKRSYFDRQRQLAVFDANDTLLWLVGERTDNRFRVTERTHDILQLEYIETLSPSESAF